MTEFLDIIPARYQSTRFPGKPLARLGSRTMIQWVYESASSVFKHLVVATDDSRIINELTESLEQLRWIQHGISRRSEES